MYHAVTVIIDDNAMTNQWTRCSEPAANSRERVSCCSFGMDCAEECMGALAGLAKAMLAGIDRYGQKRSFGLVLKRLHRASGGGVRFTDVNAQVPRTDAPLWDLKGRTIALRRN